MRAAAALLLCGLAGAVSAQPVAPDKSIEQVIVTAPRLSDEVRAAVHDFVFDYAPPAPILGTIARWNMGVCPRTYGFSDSRDDEVVTFRIRQIAAMVGAPVAVPPCKTNIEVYFADQPQHLLDGIREHGGSILLTSMPSLAKKFAVFSHPVQAWYATATRNINGRLSINNEDEPYPTFHVESRARPGLSSEFAHIYIVADVNQTHAYSFAGVTDYIAMLALAQTGAFQACQDLPSVTNLMSSPCDQARKTGAVSDTDLAFLRGVYTMDRGGSLQAQRSTIANEITSALTGRK